jgi:hypothetical protein
MTYPAFDHRGRRDRPSSLQSPGVKDSIVSLGTASASPRLFFSQLNASFVPSLVAWLGKVLVQRVGGNAVYQRSLAFFVGLILGDIVTQAGRTMVGRLLDIPVYRFLSSAPIPMRKRRTGR